jgi:hypothetical protein
VGKIVFIIPNVSRFNKKKLPGGDYIYGGFIDLVIHLSDKQGATGNIGFPVGNVQLVKVYVGLALAGSVV